MSERFFHLLFGLVLLVALYFDLKPAIYGLIAWQAFEVITNQRLTCSCQICVTVTGTLMVSRALMPHASAALVLRRNARYVWYWSCS